MPESIPTEFLDNLPIPVLVVELLDDNLNHNIIYSNYAFTKIIGWNLKEIPDKAHWWQRAYPDPKYQKVVESLWELGMESAESDHSNFVAVTVNIATKYLGVKRFKVVTELESALVDGYYVVTFEEVSEPANTNPSTGR